VSIKGSLSEIWRNKMSEDNSGSDATIDGPVEEQHKRFVESLTSEHRMLVTLRDELYFGSWERMSSDLKIRLKGRPFIFKLVNRIEEDLIRIEKLAAYELRHDENLTFLIESYDIENAE
jgi:hypothetical protein